MFDLLRQLRAPYKAPKRIAFLDAVPLSAMGKILKLELRGGLGTKMTDYEY